MEPIFEYTDYREWLRDAFDDFKKRKSVISWRYMAMKLGADPGNLLRVSQGKIHLTLSLVGPMAEFFELNEHTQGVELNEYLKPCLEGKNVGLMSEAGVPCVADPGNVAVAKAHQLDIEVVPLIGPSSIILSLMGSGLNGQNFTFHGYLPVEPYDREKKLKAIEAYAVKTGQTQIFIETPYRNRRMVDSICKVCQPATRLCIAAGLTTEQQFLKTQSVSKWRKYFDDERNLMDKRPCIFLIGR